MPNRRSLVALTAGGIAYLATLFRFLSYADRNRLPFETYLIFAGLALAIGAVTTFGVQAARYRIATYVVFGTWAAHALVVAVDLRRDPTDHNLLPFEFIILGLCAAPALIGAAVAHAVQRLME
jgi:hypothetical protein